MSFVNRVFEKVYVINLDRSPERMKELDERLRKLNIRYERISAVDGKNLSSEEIAQVATPSCAKACTFSSIGCAMSHKKAWKKVIDENIRTALILEDDAIFADNFEDRFKSSWTKVPKDWEMVYIGCTAGCGDRANYTLADWIWVRFSSLLSSVQLKEPKNGNNLIAIPDFAGGTHCYAVNNQGARKLDKALRTISLTGHIDVLISQSKSLQGNLKRYSFKDYSLVRQPLSVTSTTIGCGGSPYFGNWLMDKVYLNKRGIQGGWILSETNFRLGKTEYGGWELLYLLFGFALGGLGGKNTTIAVFALVLFVDQMIFGGWRNLRAQQMFARILLFAIALYGGKASRKAIKTQFSFR
jgi:GR25 family glycosyltransferase involved in LPS biosynthesis